LFGTFYPVGAETQHKVDVRVISAVNSRISAAAVEDGLPTGGHSANHATRSGLNGYSSLAEYLEQVESSVIRAVLQEHNANLTHTTGWNTLIRNNTRSGIVSELPIVIITYRV